MADRRTSCSVLDYAFAVTGKDTLFVCGVLDLRQVFATARCSGVPAAHFKSAAAFRILFRPSLLALGDFVVAVPMSSSLHP